MATPSTLNAVIARVAAGLYDIQLGYATMDWAIKAATSDPAYAGNLSALVQSLYVTDIKTHAATADLLVVNLVEKQVDTLDATLKADLVTYVMGVLADGGVGNEGATIISIVNGFANLTAHPNATITAAVASFNAQITAALAYAAPSGDGGNPDVPVHPPVSTFFTITAETAAGADVMHITGNQDVRIDFTNPANQITGLDVDGDGLIEFDGIERSITGMAADFEIVDAYSRNPLNHTDTANNFLGDIYFDGEGFDGDGVSTNGNIFLGGLGNDTALGGNGNDFLAGGGIAQGALFAGDTLYGGRNADFFFAEFAGIEPDGNDGGVSLRIDGGNTADDTQPGVGESPQDADWLLFEGTDEQEPIGVFLGEDAAPFDTPLEVSARTGERMHVEDVENFDASGNLYGFLDNVDVQIGARAVDTRDDDIDLGYNYGYGSSAQLEVTGSAVRNIIIGGYDNDTINGMAGNDLLMGGNLNFNNNPNLAGIINNGLDRLIGGAGADDVVFETDGGIYEGGATEDVNDAEIDTLWLTREAFGTQTVADVTSDNTVRLDLAAGKEGGFGNAAGYGGADKNYGDGSYTADQTLYATGYVRGQVQDFENVIATGLGSVDYLAAGTNDPELLFTNQQNHFAFSGTLDLRGTAGENILYAVGGSDKLEGRQGDDLLSGGNSNDDFIFELTGSVGGDGVDVIHRQTDADSDNLWDTDTDGNVLFERDFGTDGSGTTTPSGLVVDFLGTDLALAEVSVAVFDVTIGGVLFSGGAIATLAEAPSTEALASILNDLYHAQDADVSVIASGNTVVVLDAAGRVIDAGLPGTVIAGTATNGALATVLTFDPALESPALDRLIYQSYEDRPDGEKTDDDSLLGSIISLGDDNYAEDLVVSFQADGTRLAEDQKYAIKIDNATTEDVVSVSVNGVTYELTVGIDLDLVPIAAEDGQGDTQAGIQNAFMARYVAFINTFMDDDTVAGEVTAGNLRDTDADGILDTFDIIQADYNSEETVFMRTPVVDVDDNSSIGEIIYSDVTNISQHEVLLFEYDGRNNELNSDNVLFLGNTEQNRATFETALNAGGLLNGTDAILIDSGLVNGLKATVTAPVASAVPGSNMIDERARTIFDNTKTNAPLYALGDFSAHGDDFLLGGLGLDTINGGTGDDRILGSVGGNGTTTWDTLDGGKNYYAVQIVGQTQADVYILNDWEAANPAATGSPLFGLAISSVKLINQTENGASLTVNGQKIANNGALLGSGQFDDTLQFQQEDFNAGQTRFTIILNDFVVNAGSGAIELRNGGAGDVGVDMTGDGTLDNWTSFTNFENIRTVSGSGKATAGAGQGMDTLVVTALSAPADATVAAADRSGVSYDLTNRATAGEVRISTNAHASLVRPLEADFTDGTSQLVIRVDGVENVIAGLGDDLLIIDETEAAKDNLFDGGDISTLISDDRIVYLNHYDDDLDGVIDALEYRAEPTVTIFVNTSSAVVGGQDKVVMQSGRVGATPATDTLNGIEIIALENNTARGLAESDIIDVGALAGAIVNYADTALPASYGGAHGTVRTTAGVLQLTVEGLTQVEMVMGSTGNDEVILADVMANARADILGSFGLPQGEADIGFDSFLTYDRIDETVAPGFDADTTPERMSLAQLLAAGLAGPDGVIPNVINAGEYTFDLLGGTDRVNYSNETGSIAAVINIGSPITNVIVDQDGDFTTALALGDRIDTLKGAEQIVAALKGATNDSVLDFTAANQDVQISFQYSLANAVILADNQVVESIVRIADGSGNVLAGVNSFVELYKVGDYTSATVDADHTLGDDKLATWNRIEGSDKNEIVSYDGSENLIDQYGVDHRFTNDELNLRGGLGNSVSYNDLETSITAVIDFSNLEMVEATVTFQNGDGGTLVGSGTHTITSHTSANTVSTGNLKLQATQDQEDAVQFVSTDDKVFVLGTSPGVLNVKIGGLDAMILTGFEFLLDADSDDIYDFSNLINFGLLLSDNDDDHDAIRVGNDAIGFNASGVGTIDLDNIGATAGGLNYDFDVLDVTRVTASGLILNGGTDAAPVETDADETADNTDEVVLGALAQVSDINDFEAIVLTQTTVGAGTSFTFNPGAGTLTQGSTTVTHSAGVLSFGGTVFEGTVRNGQFADVTSAVTVTIGGSTAGTVHGGSGNDTITGGGGADFLRGNGGADTLDGGTAAEVRTVQFDGITDADAGDSVTLTFDADGGGTGDYVVTVTSGVEYTAGAGSDAIGAALAAKITAELALLNDQVSDVVGETAWNGGATLLTATFNATSDLLTFTFSGGVNVTGTIATATSEGGTFAISTESTTTQGSDGGIDTFVFSETAAANGADIINNYVGGSAASDDLLDFTAFLGAAAVSTAAVNFTAGLSTLGATNVGVVFNKGSLSSGDIALAAAASKVAVEDNGKAVVLVTADVDGVADATNQSYAVYYVQDTDTGAGQSYSVTLVGTINSISELDADDFLLNGDATDAFV